MGRNTAHTHPYPRFPNEVFNRGQLLVSEPELPRQGHNKLLSSQELVFSPGSVLRIRVTSGADVTQKVLTKFGRGLLVTSALIFLQKPNIRMTNLIKWEWRYW